jgi:hypothetical protein
MNKLKLFIITILTITLNSCYIEHQYSRHQEHLISHHRNNFIGKDNGGCGWHRAAYKPVENNYRRNR